METTLIFREGIDLPEFAAFTLLASERGREALRRYFEPYVEVARRLGAQLVLDTPTWRGDRDRGGEGGDLPPGVDHGRPRGGGPPGRPRAGGPGGPPGAGSGR